MSSRHIFLSVAMLFAGSSLYAQTNSTNRYIVDSVPMHTEATETSNSTHVTRVHVRAARDFNKRFAAVAANWRQSNDTTVARFTADSATTYVGYGKTGKWLYTVKSFSEWLTPAKIRHEVKSLYYDDRIELAYELVFPGNMNKVYLFYMKDRSGNSKVVRWTEEGLQLVKSLKGQTDSETLFGKHLNKR